MFITIHKNIWTVWENKEEITGGTPRSRDEMPFNFKNFHSTKVRDNTGQNLSRRPTFKLGEGAQIIGIVNNVGKHLKVNN